MHAVIRQYQLEPDAVATITPRIREIVTHYYSKILPGFVEYCVIDTGNGHVIVPSIFEDKSVAEASTHVAAGYVQDHLSAFIHNPPQVTEGEVITRVLGQTGQPDVTP